MANPTFDDGATTLTFRPGQIQARGPDYLPRQRRLVSSSGDVRVLEISGTDEVLIEIDVVELPTDDEGSFSGYDSLLDFIQSDLNWAENTFTYTDADSDSFTVRYWGEDFGLREIRKDVWSGPILLRVET